jgi:hypothetical protein
MIARTRLRAVVPALALALALALTGCGKLGTHAGSGSAASSGAGGATTSTPAVDDSAALDGISQDLDAAGTANTEAETNAQAGDQAAAAGDEP